MAVDLHVKGGVDVVCSIGQEAALAGEPEAIRVRTKYLNSGFGSGLAQVWLRFVLRVCVCVCVCVCERERDRER